MKSTMQSINLKQGEILIVQYGFQKLSISLFPPFFLHVLLTVAHGARRRRSQAKLQPAVEEQLTWSGA